MYQIQLIIEAHVCNPFQADIAALFPLMALLKLVARFPLI